MAGIFAGDMPAPQASPSSDSFAPASSGPSAQDQTSSGAAIGSTVGTIAGAYFGPVGSAAGSAIGGALGGAIAPSSGPPPSQKSAFDSSGFIVNFGRDVSGSGSGGSGTGASSGFLSSISTQLPIIIMAAAALIGVVLWKKL